MNRLQEIEARKLAIRGILEGGSECDLEALDVELKALETEKSQIEKRAAIAAGITAGTVPVTPLSTLDDPLKVDERGAKKEATEKRGKDLKELRAVTVGTSNIVLPSHEANDIKPTFNEVSSLIDRVTTLNLLGGESFTQPYLEGYGEGGETAEGADYDDAEPVFGKATIAKSKITAYSEESEETLKLPAADYDGVIVNGMSVAVRKRITKQILVGTGAANTFAGIFSAAATAISAATDLGVSAIDDKTLDEIIYAYGGDEDVEDTAVLVLNKKDLKKFATLRNSDGKKTYTVVNNGNTGTIDGVPYIINSACKAVSDAANAVGTYAMAYGPLSNYTMTIFSDLEVQRSTDFKFKSGMIAHKGVIFAGGNVTSKNGFLRVKKVAAV